MRGRGTTSAAHSAGWCRRTSAHPGPGAQTFFYTNQQSARLMWYHDHAWGITRLNVYAGGAAPYLLTDQTEQDLIGPGGALEGLGTGASLVIQDKTFVPSTETMAQADPTWQADRWGRPEPSSRCW